MHKQTITPYRYLNELQIDSPMQSKPPNYLTSPLPSPRHLELTPVSLPVLCPLPALLIRSRFRS
ncbi:hypothetical protein BO71DRAFT_403577 [Aspergillus ellipticus CBS 707.79]|uniref:Uncharacterized protein n=1 Tax=Aspergillus ellipticus CBS 707.79 TaxID=1448320 RepID=A0A319CVX9_9EURO|nr:hypothetical protein BO71DRAFT_403577 [Aspergillus ellipticus CBS 707.79]